MKHFISIIGPNRSKCTEPQYEFGIQLGEFVVNHSWGIICGGKFGFMEAVCLGARKSALYDGVSTIGIIPEETNKEANKYVDIILPTGMSYARNALVVRAGDFVISVGGGAGTLSEIALAWQMKKKIICFPKYGGWSAELAGHQLDKTINERIISLNCLEELEEYLIL